METIHRREDFAAFARRMGVRPDWHEPDEQNLVARVEGASFDNAGFWPTAESGVPWRSVELHVVFSTAEVREGILVPVEDIATVNLATLCAWAAEPHEPPGEAAEPGLPQGVYRRGDDL